MERSHNYGHFEAGWERQESAQYHSSTARPCPAFLSVPAGFGFPGTTLFSGRAGLECLVQFDAETRYELNIVIDVVNDLQVRGHA